MKTLLFVLVLIGNLWGIEAVRGRTATVIFSKVPPHAEVRFDGKTYPILPHPADAGRAFALIPVPYRTPAHESNLSVVWPGGEKRIGLRILDGNYPHETITVAPSKVKPNPAQKARTRREYTEAMNIYRTATPVRYWNRPFLVPLHSPITSPFGTARIYNGSLKSFHSGTDFKAAPGTPVAAANDGVVVIAKNRYYAGNSVVVDHGLGLYTCYYHLSRIDVAPGDFVRRGDVVGLSGATGRVTGPHLHFAAMLYGVQVDPLQLLRTLNALFDTDDQNRSQSNSK